MSGHRRWGVLARALVVTGLLAAVVPFVGARPVHAAFATAIDARQVTEGLRFESHATYTLDPAARAVHVRVELTLTNTQPNRTVGGFVREYYFPRVVLPVATEATNLSATKDDGTTLNVGTDTTILPSLSLARVDLKPALFYNQTQVISFTYDLPGQPARSSGSTRFNDAVAAFVIFAEGDPDITSVQVVVPPGFEVEIAGEDMARAVQPDGGVTYTADAIADPLKWGAGVLATNNSKLLTSDPSVPDHKISVRGWPDDPEWVTFITTKLQKGIPALEDLIGQPWSDKTDPLKITETVSPYLYGYAGWYSALDNEIAVGDELNANVILHELSHVWFNRDLFDDRWIDEGLAQEYASRAAAALGDPLADPIPIDASAPFAVKLHEWDSPRFQDEISYQREAYGYNASWAIVRAVVAEVGLEKMKLVFDAAAKKQVAYVGSGPAEPAMNTDQDWKLLLDLLEERAGSTQAEQLIAANVVTDLQASLLPTRATARAAYAALRDGGGGWSVPLPIRQSMTSWEFAQATGLMDDAKQVLALRDEITTTVQPIGERAPDALQRSYESDQLNLTKMAADADLQAAKDLVDAEKAVHGGHGVLGTIGLLGGAADNAYSAARKAFERGDGAAASAKAHKAMDLVDDANRMAIIRLVALALVVAVVFVVLRFGRPAWAHHRERRTERAAAAAAAATVAAATAAATATATAAVTPTMLPALVPPLPSSVEPPPPDPQILDDPGAWGAPEPPT